MELLERGLLCLAGEKRSREEANDGEESDDELSLIPPSKKGTMSTPRAASRKQFVSADDIILLTQVLAMKPWAYPHVMDGWQEVCDQLMGHSDFHLDKTAGACQARVTLLLDHLKAVPAPALLGSVALDSIPLVDPLKGWKANYAFWIRTFWQLFFVSIGGVLQMKRC
ncbi:ARS-binding protein 1 [Phytophthora cinnamomi]|uniref:ARS-binding protein 1 n=1 Tax=Phytophthora cinnamomi TaxID=4785 RepID=UPI00355AC1E8|nr:ARS-binding protein 1 [Phytophthora cinnamomi]